MPRRFGILALAGALVLVTGDAWAQAPAGYEETVRTATTSVYGDTGLWFVPTGEVLRDGTWSASGYRVNWDVRQGFTDISHFEGTFGFGIEPQDGDFRGRAIPLRIDRDTASIFGVGDDRLRRCRQQLSVRPRRLDWQHVRRRVPGRQVQSHVRVTPATRCAGRARHGQASNRFGRRRLGDRTNWTTQIDFIVSKEVASVAEVSGSLGYRQRRSG